MIKRLLKFLWVLFAYACLATVIAQVAIGAALWNKGGFDSERRVRLWSYLFEVDRQAIRQEVEQAQAAARSQANYTDRLGTVRRNAETKGIEQLRILETQLLEERTRYESMRDVFESRLTDLENRQRVGSVGLVRETLEILDPAQAKTILVRFLDEGALDDVVTMLVGMPPDRQRKIFAEFKSPEEVLQMNDILLRIRSQSEANSEGAGS
ncbi:MAG: hypothetical protein R3B96_09005 [Pirellulaceae bacterium]|nr:hypothetical protein [Planctomycetales bacterium]